MKSKFLHFFVAAVAWCILSASNDTYTTPQDTVLLEEVSVIGDRIYEPRSIQPLQIQQIDSLAIRMSGAITLADILERQAGVFVSNYGPAGINSVSQRGMPARHTQVMWNGISLNSQTLGSCDLSVIPAMMLSDIELSSSGSANFGSGAMGGQVQINTSPHLGVKVSQSLSSIGQRITTLEGGTQQGDWKLFARGIYENSDNDYEFEDPFSSEILNRQNAYQQQLGLGGGVIGSVGETEIESQIWWLDMDRGVPGQVTAPTTRAWQDDGQFQWMTNITHPIGNQVETGLTGYINRQNIDYFNPSSDTESLTETEEYKLRIPVSWQIASDLDLNVSGETSLVTVESTNFSEKERTVHSGNVSASWQPISRLRLYPAVRYDHYNDFGGAFSASFGGNYEVLQDALYARAYASRDFKAPTFNDLYWPGSGNPDLNPESANRMETGLYYKNQGRVAFRVDLLGFISRLEDGIEWRPISNQWQPSNVQEINASGVEVESTIITWFQGISVDWTNRYSYTRSQYGSHHQFEGNQLRFMPKHHFSTRLNLTRGPFALSTGWFGVGRRYSSPENINQDSVDPYHEWDVALAWNPEFRGADLSLRWNINNMLNHRYDAVPNYPVPGRHHMATVSISL